MEVVIKMKKRRKKKPSQYTHTPLVVGLCVLLVIVGAVVFWPKQQLKIEREAVVLRLTPDTLAKSVSELTRETQVSLLEERNGWLRVKTDNKLEGWLPRWLLNDPTLINDQAIAAQLLIETPVYSEKDESSQLVETLGAGDYQLVNQESEGWLKVSLSVASQSVEESTLEEVVGYIPTRLVNLVPEERALIHLEEDRLHKLRTYDPEAIAKARLEEEAEVRIQFANEPLYDEASGDSQVIHRAMAGDKFLLIGDFSKVEGNDFYLIENSEGKRGYVDSDRVAVSTFSVGRLEGPIVSQLSEATVMLDPGHGGVDTGALSWDGLAEEKVATLGLALEIKKHLEAKGATVLMTREGDQYVELVERTKASNVNEVDLFISLHIDGSEDSYWSGTSTYYYHETDKNLAEAVNQTLDNQALENLGMMFGNYHVLRENTRPSILLELGYISNDYDVDVIFSQEYQKSIAQAITKGLETYFTTHD